MATARMPWGLTERPGSGRCTTYTRRDQRSPALELQAYAALRRRRRQGPADTHCQPSYAALSFDRSIDQVRNKSLVNGSLQREVSWTARLSLQSPVVVPSPVWDLPSPYSMRPHGDRGSMVEACVSRDCVQQGVWPRKHTGLFGFWVLNLKSSILSAWGHMLLLGSNSFWFCVGEWWGKFLKFLDMVWVPLLTGGLNVVWTNVYIRNYVKKLTCTQKWTCYQAFPSVWQKKRVIDNFIFTKQKRNQILLQCIYDFPFYGIPLNLH
jgi:hypothetical protein